jgi:heterodisulfide reductase subunit A
MGSKVKILIVDDEPIVRESLRDWLAYAGYDVTITETGEAARKLIEEQKYGLLILDVRLPGKTGLKTLSELKERYPDIKAVIITAYPTPELAEEARQLGAIDYLSKPVVPAELEKIIRQALLNGEE